MPHIKVKATGKVVEVSDATAGQMVPKFATRVEKKQPAEKPATKPTSSKSEDN